MNERTINSYDDAMAFLLEFTDYEKVTKYKYNIATFNLDRVEDLLAAVGSPHHAFRSIHIAGTKGKGSTATMIQSILTHAGFRTGLFTSPHLCRLEERMTVDGKLMTENELVEIINELVPYTRQARQEKPSESPTFFELVTAAGFRHFARTRADFAAVEVGMGGRLDATNVISPEVCVIARVDFDHVERLGDTLGKIALEKAGIIKPGVPVVCAPQEPDAMRTISEAARQRGSPLHLVGQEYHVHSIETGIEADDTETQAAFCRFDLTGPNREYKELSLGLLGEHQAFNAACAVAAIELLEERCTLHLDEDIVRRGLAAVRLPARLEIFPGSPPVLLDGAHNPASIHALCRTLTEVFGGRRVILVMGISRDKDIPEMLRHIVPLTHAIILTRSKSPRAELPEVLAEMVRESYGIEAEIRDSPGQALDHARAIAGPQDLICVTGSFYLAGEVRPGLLDAHK